MALFLTRKDVEACLTMDDTLDAVERAFKEHGEGTTNMPVRSGIRLEKAKGTTLFMPAYMETMGAIGIKVVSVYPDNPSRYALPTTLGVVLLTDPKNGELLAIMDGTFLTAMRTGAAGGVAAKYLARKDAKKVGILGAGVQGRTQIIAASKVRRVEKVKAYDVARDRCELFCKQLSKELNIQIEPVDSAEKAVRGSDIVITTSTSKMPILNGDWLDEGTHVNAIGSHTPDTRELDAASIKRAKLVVDSREAALKEAGDIMIPLSQGLITPDQIHAELGEIVTNKKVGRISDNEITIFKSLGLAIQDVSTANKVYELALKRGVGTRMAI
ncbi:MAG: ornithine cyclodeaminase family protein [Candidatus Bathyarchaeia archaeon]|jgi:ornithine cyclodeaminase/alanine dehydrogenase